MKHYGGAFGDSYGIPRKEDEACFGEWDEAAEETAYVLPVAYGEFLEGLQDAIFGQDEVLGNIAYDIYAYLESCLDGRIAKHNFIIAGPSASGKTELYRTVRRLLKEYQCPIPVLHTDITGYSPTGFQGEELSALPESILNAGSSGYAILFLDEFDKILTPFLCANHDNFNGVLQHELLALIEGREYQIKQRGIVYTVDTGKTLFIALGAFTDYRKGRKLQETSKAIGFRAQSETPQKERDIILQMDDLLAVGGRVELLGRFDCIYNFRPMGDAAFCQLFGKLLFELAMEQGILIKGMDGAWEEFLAFAGSDFGCREVRHRLYETIKPCLIEALRSGEKRICLCIEVFGVGRAELRKRIE